MHIVSAILRRRLLQHTPVAIGGIGTLRMIRSDAQLLPGRRIDPPKRVPELAPTEQGDTYLQEIIASELGVDIVTATEICRQWNLWTLSAGGKEKGNMIVLEGIGKIRLSTLEFFPEPEFLNQLNPLSAEPLVVAAPLNIKRKRMPNTPGHAASAVRKPQIRAKGKNPHNYTISFFTVLVFLAALGFLAYYLLMHTAVFAELKSLF